MEKLLKHIFIIAILFTLAQCNNPIEPPPPGPPVIKNPSELTWTVDTLSLGPSQTTMRRIWGTSSINLYVVGHCSSPGGGMWHFDGQNWSPINNTAVNKELENIYGFGPNDIWAVGYIGGPPNETGYVVHYDGNSWQGSQINQSKLLISIWGSSSTDIWAGGRRSLFHFNGSSWEKISLYMPPDDFQLLSIKGFSYNNVYFGADNVDISKSPYTDYFLLYHYDGKSVSLIDTTDFITYAHLPRFGPILNTFDNVLFSSGSGAFRKVSNSWQVEINDSKIYYLGGTGLNNLYACGSDGKIYYNDGTSWQSIVPVQGFNVTLFNIWTDGSEVFIVGHDGWITYVLHGK